MKNRGIHLAMVLMLTLSAAAQSGKVQVKVLSEGGGRGAVAGDKVAISYQLRLANGTLVDASPDSTSYRFILGSPEIIPGLSEGMLGMRRGEIREIVVPPELGYGSQVGGPIPPDSTLYFRVELNFFEKAVEEGATLAEQFGKEGFENRPDARNLDKPAMFEFLIRDFFTRPWRYEDSSTTIWKANGLLTLLALLFWILPGWVRRGKGEPQ